MNPTTPHDAQGHPEIQLIAALAATLEGKTFIKLTLGKFRGEGEPGKAVATLVALKDIPHLKLVTSFARKDDTKTFSTTALITSSRRLARRISARRCLRRTVT